MTKSLLEVVLSEDRRILLGVALIVGGVVLRSARKEVWSSYAWLPLFLISTVLSLPALVGIIAGGFGFMAVFLFWPFPVAAVILLVARPAQRAFGLPGLIGVLVAVALALALFLVPTSVRKYSRPDYNRVLAEEFEAQRHTRLSNT